MSLTGGDFEEIVPVAMEFEPVTPRVQSGLVSPLSPPPQRKKSLLQILYRYPFADKPMVAPKGHPAFRPDSTQDNTIELKRERGIAQWRSALCYFRL